MKAPDKIYVHVRTEPRTSITFSEALEKNSSNVEYIRKDALLEWAKELKERWEEPPMSKHSPGCVYMLEQVIKKIENL